MSDELTWSEVLRLREEYRKAVKAYEEAEQHEIRCELAVKQAAHARYMANEAKIATWRAMRDLVTSDL